MAITFNYNLSYYGYRHLLLPLLDKANRTRIFSSLDFLEKSQWWPVEKLRNLQEEKLERVIHAAYHAVPYYKKIFQQRGLTPKDIRSVTDLPKLPVTEKSAIRRYRNLFINQDGNLKQGLNSFTSGSTGTPMNFVLNREQESWRWAARYRFWQWSGYKLGQPYANISVHPRNNWIKKFQDKVTGCAYLHLQKPDPIQFYNFLKKISDSEILFLVGYAHAVYLLARFAHHRKIDNISFKGIMTHGETLLPYFRKFIENQFKCRVTDLYGAGGEGFHIAAQCEHFNGYHINMENIIVEVVRSREGLDEIILTGLDNTMMPLIRYRIEDMGTLLTTKCPCGRGLGMLAQIAGRTGDLVITPDNHYLSALFFNWIFEQKQSIEQFQVIQTCPEKIIIEFIPEANFQSQELNEIENHIHQATTSRLAIEFKKVRQIPASPSGKRCWVRSEVWRSIHERQKDAT